MSTATGLTVVTNSEYLSLSEGKDFFVIAMCIAVIVMCIVKVTN